MVNSHELVHAKDGGGGYHGRCKHCQLALVTDLGFCSWDNTTCIDRVAQEVSDLPTEIQSYIRFRGLIWNSKTQTCCKPYDNLIMTVEDILQVVNEYKTN